MSLSIALTKGRLEKQTVAMLEELGYGIEALKDKGRALVFKDSIEDIQYFLVKSNDCITYVNHGVADIGVDLHQEFPADNHRFGFGMVDVCRDDGTPGSNFFTDKFGSDI